MAQHWRQMTGGPDADISDDEFAEIRRRGTAAIDLARSLGDELAYSVVVAQFAMALEFRLPDEAMALAVEASAIADRLGAVAWRNIALALHHRCMASAAVRNEPRSTGAMRSLRKAIVTAVDSDSPGDVMVLSAAALPHIGPTDPDAALTFFARLRAGSGMSPNAYLENAGIPVPEDWSEWEARAARLSLVDAAGLVLAALDRVIAEAEAEVEVEGSIDSGGDA
jgi:hypothetical protein